MQQNIEDSSGLDWTFIDVPNHGHGAANAASSSSTSMSGCVIATSSASSSASASKTDVSVTNPPATANEHMSKRPSPAVRTNVPKPLSAESGMLEHPSSTAATAGSTTSESEHQS